MNGNKLMKRYTVYWPLFLICTIHINVLEWRFLGCYIISSGLATLVMSIACLLLKRNLHTDRVFTSGCLMNCKIDFGLMQLERCPPFWHRKSSSGMTKNLFISNVMMILLQAQSCKRSRLWGFLGEWTRATGHGAFNSCDPSWLSCQIERKPLCPGLALEWLISQRLGVIS